MANDDKPYFVNWQELCERQTEALADRDKRIAELEARCERVRLAERNEFCETVERCYQAAMKSRSAALGEGGSDELRATE